MPLAIDWGVRPCDINKHPFVFIPLHKGADGFLSDEDFRTFYWPSFKKVLLGLIEQGIVPLCFAEGGYNDRLEAIHDPEIPAGKMIWMFDATNMQEAKKHLGGYQCIGGNVPGALLTTGTVQDMDDYVRQLMEDVAGDGGFILGSGIVIDAARSECVKAMIDAGKKYGAEGLSDAQSGRAQHGARTTAEARRAFAVVGVRGEEAQPRQTVSAPLARDQAPVTIAGSACSSTPKTMTLTVRRTSPTVPATPPVSAGAAPSVVAWKARSPRPLAASVPLMWPTSTQPAPVRPSESAARKRVTASSSWSARAGGAKTTSARAAKTAGAASSGRWRRWSCPSCPCGSCPCGALIRPRRPAGASCPCRRWRTRAGRSPCRRAHARWP